MTAQLPSESNQSQKQQIPNVLLAIFFGVILEVTVILILNYFNIIKLSQFSSNLSFLPHKTILMPTSNNTTSQDEVKPTPIPGLMPGKIIDTYLVSVFWKPGDNNQMFCITYPFGRDLPQTNPFHQFVWALCQDYSIKNGTLVKGLSISKPILLTIEYANDAFSVTTYTVADENTYNQYPHAIRQNTFLTDTKYRTDTLQQLQNTIDNQAKSYFKL